MRGSWKKMVVNYDQDVEWHDLKREVLDRQIYYFQTENPAPVIVDAGAHIGLATLYFKWLYPEARVWAFEPNPHVRALLEQNVAENNLTGVTVMPQAVSNHAGTAKFYIDATDWRWWSVGSMRRGAWNGEQKNQKEITVESIKFSDFVQNFTTIDLLKLDIEGSEQAILYSLRGQLSKIKQLIFEFHPTREQNLTDLTRFLRKSGFEIAFKNRKNQKINAWHDGELVLVEAERDG